ncbi:luciferase family oxidoreductase group 1 [Paenibacillus phyllosphaerae]|uniref:Luciferase family oxidoreductase group 1 n=1 Tax=Paenibacillus phyllosphaerae TaxID=274593 RepID=A0A7W5AXI5_9BACL|nr:MsnO8 family LLM class oxidoreductase [Paenibacillus phyllosphaerae]MBB3110304.1 luciferase family oxidoreductase group 1 [Paenibacillus phyllosphaerae]
MIFDNVVLTKDVIILPTLKLGVLDLVPVYGKLDDETALKQAVQLAQAAEELGYIRYWTAEHHGMPMLACASPEVLLAHIGARTNKIRLGTGALLLPHYKPLKVMENFHLLACLYPDRIDLGLGRAPGGSGPVSLSLSDNFIANIAKVPEALRTLLQLRDGTYKVEGESVIARPSPRIPPEVWLLGTNKKSAALAAENGTGYVFGQFMSDVNGVEVVQSYRTAFQPAAASPEPRIIVAIGVICAPTDAEAQRLAAEADALYPVSASGEAIPQDAVPKRLVGTPPAILDELEKLANLYGTDEFLIQTAIPDYAKRMLSYEALAQENSKRT